VAAACQDLRHGRNVRQRNQAQERDHHGLFQCDGGEHQHAQGGDGRDHGELPTVTHVAHVFNHPRYFTT
jgi:hypothetical protein